MRDMHAGVEHHNGSVVKGAIAGAVGGLVASLVMEQFQNAVSKVGEKIKQARCSQEIPDDDVRLTNHNSFELRSGEAKAKLESEQHDQSEDEPANIKAAEMISEKVLGQPLPKRTKPVAGELVHYAMGVSSSAIYGAFAEVTPVASAGIGAPFGTAVWLLADEIAVPALGLSKAPTKYPFSTHLYAFVSHAVYGIASDAVRRMLRNTVLR